MSQMPDDEISVEDDPDNPRDPMLNAYEDYQESDRYQNHLAHIREVAVDSEDAGPFLRKDITLQEVIGQDAATDVAAEGLIIGFETGFEYGTRGALGAFRKRLIEDQIERYGIVLPDIQGVVDALADPDELLPTPNHDHKPVQHRDGKPPWCRACGLTATYEVPKSRFQKGAR